MEEAGAELLDFHVVEALPVPFSGAPHWLQNSLPWGGTAEHDGQSPKLALLSRAVR
jgi:hypothetical protein